MKVQVYILRSSIGGHADSQVLSEVRHRLVDVLLWQLPRLSAMATFNSSIVSGFDCQRWSLGASAVTLSVSKSAPSSHHYPTGYFQSHQQTTGKHNARNAEKWGLSWLKQHNFAIFRFIST